MGLLVYVKAAKLITLCCVVEFWQCSAAFIFADLLLRCFGIRVCDERINPSVTGIFWYAVSVCVVGRSSGWSACFWLWQHCGSPNHRSLCLDGVIWCQTSMFLHSVVF